jgi:hypothetical protein
MPIYSAAIMASARLAVIVAAGAGIASAQQLWSFHGQRTLDEAFQVPAAEFTEGRVLDLCQAFLAASSGYSVARYFVVTDRADAIENLRGPRVSDIDFPDWRRRYEGASPHPPATAELIKVRDQAVVRLRFDDGEIRQQVIGVGNPLQIDLHGEALRVLEVSPIPPGVVMRAPYPGGAHFYVQTPRPWTLTLAEEFNRFLQARAGLANVAITIEDGWWFAGEPTYPIYNRFLPYMEPPSFEEFKRHTRFYCQDLSGGCIQRGPAKQQ